MRSGHSPRRPGANLTRISVTGSGDCYIVRNGGTAPVRVWLTRAGLRCECGETGCAHIASLHMCGFVDPAQENAEAA